MLSFYDYVFCQFATDSMKILEKAKSAMVLEPNRSFRNGSWESDSLFPSNHDCKA